MTTSASRKKKHGSARRSFSFELGPTVPRILDPPFDVNSKSTWSVVSDVENGQVLEWTGGWLEDIAVAPESLGQGIKLRDIFKQAARSARLAFAMTSHDFRHLVTPGRTIVPKIGSRPARVLDVVAPGKIAYNDNDRALEYLIDERHNLPVVCPLPRQVTSIGARPLLEVLNRTSESELLTMLEQALSRLVATASNLLVAPCTLTLDRLLVSEDGAVDVLCADLATGPLVRHITEAIDHESELKYRPEVTVFQLAQAWSDALSSCASRLGDDLPLTLRRLLNLTRTVGLKTDTENETRALERFGWLMLDGQMAALDSMRRSTPGISIYLDMANIGRALEGDFTIRWSRILPKIVSRARWFDRGGVPPITGVVANTRTGDPRRFPKFFESVRRYHDALCLGQTGRIKGDQADDIALLERCRTDIERGVATHAVVLSNDRKMLRDHWRDHPRDRVQLVPIDRELEVLFHVHRI